MNMTGSHRALEMTEVLWLLLCACRGEKGGDGGCLGVDYEREGIERGVVMGRTHTAHDTRTQDW